MTTQVLFEQRFREIRLGIVRMCHVANAHATLKAVGYRPLLRESAEAVALEKSLRALGCLKVLDDLTYGDTARMSSKLTICVAVELTEHAPRAPYSWGCRSK